MTVEETGKETENTEEAITLTQTELQRLIDSKITAAVKTRENNLEAKYSQLMKSVEEDKEKEKRSSLEEANKLLDEYKSKAAKYELEKQTKEALKEVDATDVAGLFDFDTSTVEGRKSFAMAYKEQLKASVEAEIKNKLNTGTPATTKTTHVEKDLSSMTTEEYKAYKKQNNIF